MISKISFLKSEFLYPIASSIAVIISLLLLIFLKRSIVLISVDFILSNSSLSTKANPPVSSPILEAAKSVIPEILLVPSAKRSCPFPKSTDTYLCERGGKSGC